MLKKISIVFFILIGLVVLNWWNVKQSEKKEVVKEQQELLLDLKEQNFTKIVVHNASGEWQLVKRVPTEDGSYSDPLASFAQEFELQPQWLIEWDNMSYLADQSMVEGFLDDLSQAKKDKYIAKGSEKFSSYGVSKEKSEIKIYEGEPKKLNEVLTTGDLNTMGSQLYVGKSNQEIYLSSQQLKESQTETANSYTHKKVIALNDPEKIVLKHKEGEFELVKIKNQWQLQKPIVSVADDLIIEGMLNYLNDFEIDSLLEKGEFSTLIKNSLLDKPDFYFEIKDKNGTKKLYIDESRPKGGQNTPYHAFIYRNDLPFVFKKSPIDPGHFYYALSDLAVKKVFSVKANEIKSFKVIQNHASKNFVQNNDEWIEEGINNNQDAVNFGASYALFALKANKFLKQNKNKKLTVDYVISIQNNAGQEQTLIVYKEPYKQDNLSYVQAYSSAYNSQLLFDSKDIEAISNAVTAVMNFKK